MCAVFIGATMIISVFGNNMTNADSAYMYIGYMLVLIGILRMLFPTFGNLPRVPETLN
jgi:hypothetical protein